MCFSNSIYSGAKEHYFDVQVRDKKGDMQLQHLSLEPVLHITLHLGVQTC